ncbi:hypothetical protein Hamer_G025290, partial [Homarus americanus]
NKANDALLSNPQSAALRANRCSLRAEAQRTLRSMENESWQARAQDIQSFTNENDHQGFYNAIKAIHGPAKCNITPVRSLGGELKDKQQIQVRWAKHFGTSVPIIIMKDRLTPPSFVLMFGDCKIKATLSMTKKPQSFKTPVAFGVRMSNLKPGKKVTRGLLGAAWRLIRFQCVLKETLKVSEESEEEAVVHEIPKVMMMMLRSWWKSTVRNCPLRSCFELYKEKTRHWKSQRREEDTVKVASFQPKTQGCFAGAKPICLLEDYHPDKLVLCKRPSIDNTELLLGRSSRNQ